MTEPTQRATPVERQRDPQNFTRGDILAWKIVAYFGGAVTVIGITTAFIVLVTFATS